MSFPKRPASWLMALAILVSTSSLEGQICFRPKPLPACKLFLVTEFGGLLTLGTPEARARRQLVNWEVGLMHNLNKRSAFGGALYFSYSHHAEIYAGPKLRYRYWFSPYLSLEAGVGPLWRLNYLESGTFFTSQFGVNYRDLATLFLQLDFFENTIASLGIKIGSWPGTIVAIVAAGVAGGRYLIERIE